MRTETAIHKKVANTVVEPVQINTTQEIKIWLLVPYRTVSCGTLPQLLCDLVAFWEGYLRAVAERVNFMTSRGLDLSA